VIKMTLVCYHKDWLLNANAWKRKTDIKNANKIVKKLRRHFKVEWEQDGMSAYFIPRQRKGTASIHTNRITLPAKDISLGIICHEIAHLVSRKRYGSTGHNKKFMKALKIVNKYAEKKHYFDNEVNWNIQRKHAREPGWFNPWFSFPRFMWE